MVNFFFLKLGILTHEVVQLLTNVSPTIYLLPSMPNLFEE